MAGAPQWKDLPSDLLFKVATSCPVIINQMRGVCKPWKTSIEATATFLIINNSALPIDLPARFTSLAHLGLPECKPEITTRGIRTLLGMPSLTSLSIYLVGSVATKDMLDVLSRLPVSSALLELRPSEITKTLADGLHALSHPEVEFVPDTEIAIRAPHAFTGAHLRLLEGLAMSTLNLSHTSLGDDGMAALRGIPLLKSLDLSDLTHEFTNEGLAEIRDLELAELKLAKLYYVSDESLELLKEMPLQILNLSECPNLSDAGLEFLKGLPLQNLDLSCCDFTNEGLGFLKGLPLTSLNLKECHSVEELGGLEGLQLEYLNLKGLIFDDEGGLEVLRGMPLTDLVLPDGCTDQDLEVLRGKSLTRLDLEGEFFMGGEGGYHAEGLEVLAGMALTDLDASRNPTVRGEFLRALPLTRLAVCMFADSDLEGLRGMGLVDLKLKGCPAITNRGLGMLQGLQLTKIYISDAGKIQIKG